MKLLLFDDAKVGKVIYKTNPSDEDFSENPFLIHYALPDRFTAKSSVDQDDGNFWTFTFQAGPIETDNGKLRFEGFIRINTSTPADAAMDVTTRLEAADGSASTTHVTPKLKCDDEIRMKNPFGED